MKPESVSADEKGGKAGDGLPRVYRGYFGDPRIHDQFADACVVPVVTNTLANGTSVILGVGSGTGDVERTVNRRLIEQGASTRLILSDALPPDALGAADPSVDRLCANNSHLPFAEGSMDLVLARSVTHYEADLPAETAVLEEIRRVLKPDRYFVTQAPAFATKEEALILRDIHLLVGKPMNVQSSDDVRRMLSGVFSSVDVSPVTPDPLEADEAGFFARYGIDAERETLRKRLRQIVSAADPRLLPHISSGGETISWKVPYRIFLCRK